MQFRTAIKIIDDVFGTISGKSNFTYNQGARPCGKYPLDLNFTLANEARYYSPKDSYGIPLKQYQKFGVQYNPTRIAAYALAHFNRYMDGYKDHLSTFMKMADWFLEKENGRFEYHFKLSGLRPPWLSAMAQGEAVSVLARAHLENPNKGYLENAILALQPLIPFVETGGLRSKINKRWAFLEEYPKIPPPHTLNGFLYAIIGILDLTKIEPKIVDLIGLNDLLYTLSHRWKLWDLKYGSAYDLHQSKKGYRNPATIDYHKIHIILMRYIGEVTDRSELIVCSDNWNRQLLKTPNRLRAIFGKILYRLQEPAER